VEEGQPRRPLSTAGNIEEKTMNLDELSPGFWEAILRVHYFLFEAEREGYYQTPASERANHIFESVMILGSWLVVAEERGLLRELDS